jgi:hypothetical protein
MAIFTKPHAVRKEVKKDSMPEWAEKSVALLAERLSKILSRASWGRFQLREEVQQHTSSAAFPKRVRPCENAPASGI